MEPPLIYNLFPRLAGPMDRWTEHAERARSMGFGWVYFNPLTQPGFSGSLYAVQDPYRLCRDFLPAGVRGAGLDELREVLGRLAGHGLRPVMDLVINHAAIDSVLVRDHPEWFVRDERGDIVHPSAIDPADARRVTVWGDLAEIDNAASPDRAGLWNYWRDLVRTYLELGFEGFRCDAAYKVPARLWTELTGFAREVKPGAVFFAETLGCRIAEIEALRGCGLDYLFNSSKYWNFDAAWALEQHEQFGKLFPSVSFAESHDTPRLMAEVRGNLAVVRQRYLLSAIFAEGLLMPIGFEFGFTKPLHVVDSRPGDWEETGVDLRGFIREVNRLKLGLPVLRVEGRWEALTPWDGPTLILRKSAPSGSLLALVNKDWHQGHALEVEGAWVADQARLRRIPGDCWIEEKPGDRVELRPAEIALVG